MPKVLLSDVGLRSLQPPDSGTLDYWDTALPSFGVRISQGGARTFILKLDNSRRKIGRYPTLTLAKAREEARRQLAERTLGKFRPQAVAYTTVRELFLAEKRKSRRPNTVRDLEARLERHFPFKGQVGDITHADIARRLSRITGRSEHDHALAVARNFFTWCHNRRYISDNPTRGLSPYGSHSRTRVLTDPELAAVWRAADNAGTFGQIIQLLILTGCRRGEVQHLTLDGSIFTLDARHAKNGREHHVPASPLAQAIFARSTTRTWGGWSKSKLALDTASDITDWTIHDLRRTFASGLARLGTPIHVVEKLLNHVSGTHGGIVGVYQRHQYFDEQVEAIAKWDAHICAITATG